MKAFQSNYSYTPIPLEEESERPLTPNTDFVVVGSLRDFWKNLFTICVENGDGLFPSLPNSHTEQPKSLWDHLFGKEKREYALYVRNDDGECFGLESKRTNLPLSSCTNYQVIQVINGKKHVILPRNFTQIRGLQIYLMEEVLVFSKSNRTYPIYESAIRFGNVILSELGEKVGVSDMRKFISSAFWERKQQHAFIEKLYGLDIISIHPLYYIFAFTEIGRSLRYFKLLKKFDKRFSQNLETILATNSMKVLKEVCSIDHFKHWLHIPRNSPFYFEELKQQKFDWLKTRFCQSNREDCRLGLTIKIDKSSCSNARKELIQRSQAKMKVKASFKSRHISCCLVEETISQQCKDIIPIYWSPDTFQVESNVDLMVLSEECLGIVSQIESTINMNNEYFLSHIGLDFVDMKYFYKIELYLERAKQICSSMPTMEDSMEIVQTLSNQIKVVEMFMMSMVQIVLNEELDIDFSNKFNSIMMLSEWIDHCLNFIKDIVKHFSEDSIIDQPFLEEMILEQIVKNDDLDWKNVFEMTKYLSSFASILYKEEFTICAGRLVSGYSKWISSKTTN